LGLFPGLNAAVGDAFVAMLDWSWPRIAPRVEAAARVIAEAVRPEPPLTLRTPDGELITGLVVLNRGQALLFIGIREHGPHTAHPPPLRDAFHEDSVWSSEMRVDPYRRHR
jgi:hypothetical protein